MWSTYSRLGLGISLATVIKPDGNITQAGSESFPVVDFHKTEMRFHFYRISRLEDVISKILDAIQPATSEKLIIRVKPNRNKLEWEQNKQKQSGREKGEKPMLCKSPILVSKACSLLLSKSLLWIPGANFSKLIDSLKSSLTHSVSVLIWSWLIWESTDI